MTLIADLQTAEALEASLAAHGVLPTTLAAASKLITDLGGTSIPTPPYLNVLDYGVKGDGATDNTAALNSLFANSPEGSCFYFPQGQYLVTGPLVLNSHKTFSMVGDCMMSGGNFGSTVIGNMAANLVSANNGHSQTFQISKMNFVNTSTLPGSTAFYSSNAICSSFRDCSFSGSNGLWLDSPFSTTVDTCHFNGLGWKVLGTGLTITGSTNTVLLTPDFMGWNYAAKLTGNGITCLGVRCETNHVGLALGMNPDGTQGFLNRGAFLGGGMEANDIGFDVMNVSGVVIAGIGVQGSLNAPAGLSITGLQIHASAELTVESCQMGGAYSGASWLIGYNGPLLTKTHFQSCQGNNGGGSGTVWSVTTPGCTWSDCDFRTDNWQALPVAAGAAFLDIKLQAPQFTFNGVGQFSVFGSPNWNTTYWSSNKTVNGFRLNFGTPAPAGGGLVDGRIT